MNPIEKLKELGLKLPEIIGLNHISASGLFVNVLGNKSQHSRAIFGVKKLPRNFCAGLTTSFTVKTK